MNDPRDLPAPPLPAGRLAMAVFLAGLGIFFASSLLMYAYVRYGGPRVPPAGTIAVPTSLWTSTALLVALSVALEGAHVAVKRERQGRFRVLLALAFVLALGFMAAQVPALAEYLAGQADAQRLARGAGELGADWDPKFAAEIELRAGPREGQILLAAATLVALHALHVLGGVLPLAITMRNAFRGRYDHEWHRGVTACVWYWHFLDAVWLALFACFHLLA